MGLEIERKFIVKKNIWQKHRDNFKNKYIKQAYLNTEPNKNVRVRIKGEKSFLTIKGKTENISRVEFEYAIPLEDAKEIMNLCEKAIEKYRYECEIDGLVWEVDEFMGENDGLIIAEIELNSEDQQFELPKWIDREVSDDNRYFNAYIIDNPYNTW